MATIIVVDDEATVRDLLRDSLEEAGHIVADYHDGRGALEQLTREPADVLVTDIFMPEMEGLETIRLAHALRPEMQIIAISGVSLKGADYLYAARHFGAFAALKKPFSPTVLVRLVDELLHQNTV